MSIEVLSESYLIARKDHRCDACEFVYNNLVVPDDLTPEEAAVMAKAEENKRMIKKGEKYCRQNNKYDGELYTFKAIPEVMEICFKYELFEV